MIAQLPPRTAALITAGPMRLLIDGEEIPLSSRKALAILTYLALQSSRSEQRERIAALLWSDSDGDRGRASLRQTLRRLKADLGPAADLLEADRETLRLTQPLRLDILDAITAAAAGNAPPLLGTDGADLGRLLVDLDDLDPDFGTWVKVQRERLTHELMERLEEALAAQTLPAARLPLAEALLRADPTHESACRAAMRAHLARGDTTQAMRVYERLWHILQQEFEVEPSDRTQDLYVAIKQGIAQPAMPVPSLEATHPRIAIVVEAPSGPGLPGDFAHFGAVFRDQMMTALARFRDWLVIDGTEHSPPPEAYRTYSLRITLMGREDNIVAALVLVDQADNRFVWAERHTATLDGISALHQTALRHLALALNVHLSVPRQQSARVAATPMGRNYELWMRSQALMGEWRADLEERAERILRDLIDGTPDFAPALVALARILNAGPIVCPGRPRRPEILAESLLLTDRAVKLDPLDSRAHLARSWSHAIAGSHSAALSHLDLALDLNENDPWTIISAALGFAFADQIDQARDLVAQARAFGMRYSCAAQGYVAATLYLCEDFEGAVSTAELAGDAIINLPAWSAASQIALGDRSGAAHSMAVFLERARLDWTGPAQPTDGQIIDWFMRCFPVRAQRTRDELRRRLSQALIATKKAAG